MEEKTEERNESKAMLNEESAKTPFALIMSTSGGPLHTVVVDSCNTFDDFL